MRGLRPILNAMRVGGSGGGGGSAIETSSPDAWWRADSGVTEAGSGVSSWVDKTVNAFDAVQTTDAERPVLVSSAINGQPAIDFDGSDDVLEIANNPLGLGTGDITIATVSTVAGGNAERVLFSARDYLSEGVEIDIDSLERPGYAIEDTATTTDDDSVSTVLNSNGTVNHVILTLDRDVGATLYLNATGAGSFFGGGDITGVTGALSVSDTPLYIGAKGNTSTFRQRFHDAYIAEIIVWKRKLTDTEINDIGAELVTRYGGAFTGPV